MRLSLYAIAMALCLPFMGLSAASAAPLTAGGNSAGVGLQTMLEKVQYGYCQQLRYRCENKEDLGEWGEGNCRRYRRECGWRVSYCENLRYRCNNKEHLDEEGNGNCRRYRRECGGGYDN